MAQILSFVMMVFLLIPVIAPTMGAFVAFAFGWRAVFVAFAIFSILSTCWLVFRQPETLPVERRRPLRPAVLIAGVKEIFSNRQVVLATIAQTLIFSVLFGALMTSQQIFGETFGKADTFHYWFGFMAICSAPANIINAAIDGRLGMRRVVFSFLVIEAVLTTLYLLALLSAIMPDALEFPLAIAWLISLFYLAGFGVTNMNTIAMEPMGHMSGLAASVTTATATICSAVVAVAIGQAFDGTIVPLAIGVFVLVLLALGVVYKVADTSEAEAAAS